MQLTPDRLCQLYRGHWHYLSRIWTGRWTGTDRLYLYQKSKRRLCRTYLPQCKKMGRPRQRSMAFRPLSDLCGTWVDKSIKNTGHFSECRFFHWCRKKCPLWEKQLLPCLNVVALAFNDGVDAARGGVWFWPRQFTMDNFKEVFKDGSSTTAYVITIARTVIGTFLSLMVTTLAGYALKQEDLPGRVSQTGRLRILSDLPENHASVK